MIKKVVRLFRLIRPKVNLYPSVKKGKSRFKVFALYSDDIYVSWYDGKSDKAGTHVYCYSTVYTHTPLTTYPSPPSNFTRNCESFREIWSLGGALGHAKYTLSEVKKILNGKWLRFNEGCVKKLQSFRSSWRRPRRIQAVKNSGISTSGSTPSIPTHRARKRKRKFQSLQKREEVFPIWAASQTSRWVFLLLLPATSKQWSSSTSTKNIKEW